MPDLSIIIPVYNLRRYLPATLRNFTTEQFSQTKPGKWELIVVDDGSSDGSHLEVQRYAELYPTAIHLIRTPNRGVSAARNVGTEVAKGKYLIFVDGDDLIKQNSLPKLIDAALQSECDVLHFGNITVNENEYNAIISDGIPKATSNTIEWRPVDAKQFLLDTNAMAGPPIQWNIWQNLFRKDFITDNRCSFMETLSIGEDSVFMWSIMLSAPNIAITDETFYIYNIRKDSVIHNNESTHIRKSIDARMTYLDFLYNIHKRLLATQYDKKVIYGLKIEIRNVFYRAIADMILCGIGIHEIMAHITNYSHNGGEIRIGRPRFNYCNSISPGFAMKLSRWLLAYPIGILLKAFKH